MAPSFNLEPIVKPLSERMGKALGESLEAHLPPMSVVEGAAPHPRPTTFRNAMAPAEAAAPPTPPPTPAAPEVSRPSLPGAPGGQPLPYLMNTDPTSPLQGQPVSTTAATEYDTFGPGTTRAGEDLTVEGAPSPNLFNDTGYIEWSPEGRRYSHAEAAGQSPWPSDEEVAGGEFSPQWYRNTLPQGAAPTGEPQLGRDNVGDVEDALRPWLQNINGMSFPDAITHTLESTDVNLGYSQPYYKWALEALNDVVKEVGASSVFDSIVRVKSKAPVAAQGYFDVTPDGRIVTIAEEDANNAFETFVHEMQHGAILSTIDSATNLVPESRLPRSGEIGPVYSDFLGADATADEIARVSNWANLKSISPPRRDAVLAMVDARVRAKNYLKKFLWKQQKLEKYREKLAADEMRAMWKHTGEGSEWSAEQRAMLIGTPPEFTGNDALLKSYLGRVSWDNLNYMFGSTAEYAASSLAEGHLQKILSLIPDTVNESALDAALRNGLDAIGMSDKQNMLATTLLAHQKLMRPHYKDKPLIGEYAHDAMRSLAASAWNGVYLAMESARHNLGRIIADRGERTLPKLPLTHPAHKAENALSAGLQLNVLNRITKHTPSTGPNGIVDRHIAMRALGGIAPVYSTEALRYHWALKWFETGKFPTKKEYLEESPTIQTKNLPFEVRSIFEVRNPTRSMSRAMARLAPAMDRSTGEINVAQLLPYEDILPLAKSAAREILKSNMAWGQLSKIIYSHFATESWANLGTKVQEKYYNNAMQAAFGSDAGMVHNIIQHELQEAKSKAAPAGDTPTPRALNPKEAESMGDTLHKNLIKVFPRMERDWVDGEARILNISGLPMVKAGHTVPVLSVEGLTPEDIIEWLPGYIGKNSDFIAAGSRSDYSLVMEYMYGLYDVHLCINAPEANFDKSLTIAQRYGTDKLFGYDPQTKTVTQLVHGIKDTDRRMTGTTARDLVLSLKSSGELPMSAGGPGLNAAAFENFFENVRERYAAWKTGEADPVIDKLTKSLKEGALDADF